MIPIGTKYRIGLDGMNVTVFQRCKPRKAGAGGSWRPIGYYSSFKNALEGLVDHDVKQPDLKDLKMVVKKQDELHKLIESLELPSGFPQRRTPERVKQAPLVSRGRGHNKPPTKRKEIVGKKAVVGMLKENPKGTKPSRRSNPQAGSET
jgi:hypothetical protein